jgi:hypothetical protein
MPDTRSVPPLLTKVLIAVCCRVDRRYTGWGGPLRGGFLRLPAIPLSRKAAAMIAVSHGLGRSSLIWWWRLFRQARC